MALPHSDAPDAGKPKEAGPDLSSAIHDAFGARESSNITQRSGAVHAANGHEGKTLDVPPLRYPDTGNVYGAGAEANIRRLIMKQDGPKVGPIIIQEMNGK